MKTLHFQIQPERSPFLDVLAAIRKLTEAGDRVGAMLTMAEGTDGVRYINLDFRHTSLATLWDILHVEVASTPGLATTSIVCCEGNQGWEDYLLLHHFDPSQPLDELRHQSS